MTPTQGIRPTLEELVADQVHEAAIVKSEIADAERRERSPKFERRVS